MNRCRECIEIETTRNRFPQRIPTIPIHRAAPTLIGVGELMSKYQPPNHLSVHCIDSERGNSLNHYP